jgi:cell division protein FtsI/penicillin-binding protein 2
MKKPKRTRSKPQCRETAADKRFGSRAKHGAILFVSAFSLLSMKLVHVQHTQHENWMEKRDLSRRKTEPLTAPSGTIYDYNYVPLACNLDVESVIFDNNEYLHNRYKANGEPEKRTRTAIDRIARILAAAESKRDWTEIRKAWSDDELRQRYVRWIAELIAPALEKPADQIFEEIVHRNDSKGKPTPVDAGETTLAKGIKASQQGALRAILAKHSILGISFRHEAKRQYPTDVDLWHLIGITNTKGPVCGLEYARAADLFGTDGSRTYEIDGRGEEIPTFKSVIVPPIPGKSLRTTLNFDLQELVEATVDEVGTGENEVYLKNLNAERVTVLLMDAKTMAIRAAVCREKGGKPGFWNPILEGCFEPGSTMKIFTLAAALESGKVRANTEIDCHNGYYDDEDVEPINDDHAFSSLTVTNILVNSSNIGAFKLAKTVGIKDFHEYLGKFGFGKKTGVECRNETPGIFKAPGQWDYNVLARTSFGYNIGVTPVQMCAALGVILNDGLYRKPYMVEEVLDAKRQVLEKHVPGDPVRVVSVKTARTTRDAMLDVVEEGTGDRAQSFDYWLAGKTATARSASVNAKGKTEYLAGDYCVSFLGYAPADNPKLIGLVVIDKPRADSDQLYGGKLAAPVFRRVMERAMRFYEVPVQEVAHSKKKVR